MTIGKENPTIKNTIILSLTYRTYKSCQTDTKPHRRCRSAAGIPSACRSKCHTRCTPCTCPYNRCYSRCRSICPNIPHTRSHGSPDSLLAYNGFRSRFCKPHTSLPNRFCRLPCRFRRRIRNYNNPRRDCFCVCIWSYCSSGRNRRSHNRPPSPVHRYKYNRHRDCTCIFCKNCRTDSSARCPEHNRRRRSRHSRHLCRL